ncbi:hypothetical protein [Streptomyces sp. NPDC057412]|uniref:hypothetical protein n=1 Tax=Streptomyces sp. NPDC057412 TaxID=3346123 RepID=UPI0036CA8220
MSNSYAQPVLRTPDLSEAMTTVERLLGIADLRCLEVDFTARLSTARSYAAVAAAVPDADWWAAAGGGGSSERGDDPTACLPIWLQKWAGTPDMVDPFLEAIGDSPAAVRWDFNAWPAVPELGLDIGGTRGAFVTLCAHARDLELDEPADDYTVFVHVKQIEAERAPWLAAQVGLTVIGDLVMAP